MKIKILLLMLIFLTVCSCENIDVTTEPEPTSPEIEPETETNIINPITPTYNDPYEGYFEILDGVYVNHLPGVYEGNLTLNFKFEDKNGLLYYSLDCSEPSTLYNDEININLKTSRDIEKYPLTTSVDAILADNPNDRCISYMYIKNIQETNFYFLDDLQNVITLKYIDSNGTISSRTLTYLNKSFDIPVISLSMPYDEWFGEENGFYNKITEEMEKRVNLEYFDFEYNEYFYRNSKIKLGGNYSLGFPQRTLNLNFNKDENGNKNEKVTAHVFKERNMVGNSEERLTNLTRFRLHNGGNNFESRAGFNDAILHNLMYGTNVSTTAYRPCITYLNGEYWGIYSIREHYSDTYFEDNYGIDKDDIALYELRRQIKFDDGNEENAMQFIDEMNEYLNKDFSNNNVYEEFINTYIDVDSFIDVVIAHSYVGNNDFIGNYNNLKMWRSTRIDPNNPYADGKLRFCLHDADFSFEDTTNYLDPNNSRTFENFKLYKKLCENMNFKLRLYNRAQELINTNLSYENAANVVKSMVAEIEYYKFPSMKRWGSSYSLATWKNECNEVLEFIKNRNETYLDMIEKTYFN